MELRSPAFEHNGDIPTEYTCEAADISPPLTRGFVPGNARRLHLMVDDPDAPDPAAPRRAWVHWAIYKLPPADGGLSKACTDAKLPVGAVEGLNDWNATGYEGPCPTPGRHRCVHRLFALDATLSDLSRTTRRAAETALGGHRLTSTQLIGTYLR
jgi:Raf kinase inhibitor-like YbhB/YbcL family protein